MSSRLPRAARPAVMLAVAVILVSVTAGITGCSGHPSTPVAPAVSATGGTVRPPATPGVSSPSPVTFVLARSTPVRLQISAIGVDSTLMALGLGADGSMQVPPGGFPAGWYTGGPTPGELGPAVIAGHVDMKGPGVFYALHDLKPGDLAIVTRADGTRPVFRITRVALFKKDTFPTRQVFGNISHPGLRLITCGGAFNTRTGHYEDNIVAFADLAGPAR